MSNIESNPNEVSLPLTDVQLAGLREILSNPETRPLVDELLSMVEEMPQTAAYEGPTAEQAAEVYFDQTAPIAIPEPSLPEQEQTAKRDSIQMSMIHKWAGTSAAMAVIMVGYSITKAATDNEAGTVSAHSIQSSEISGTSFADPEPVREPREVSVPVASSSPTSLPSPEQLTTPAPSANRQTIIPTKKRPVRETRTTTTDNRQTEVTRPQTVAPKQPTQKPATKPTAKPSPTYSPSPRPYGDGTNKMPDSWGSPRPSASPTQSSTSPRPSASPR